MIWPIVIPVPIYLFSSSDDDDKPMTDEECKNFVKVCVLLFSFLGGLIYFMW